MKKYFAFVAAALVAFGFAACNPKGGNEPTADSKDFKIEVSDIAAKKATVTVTPTDAEGTYYWNVFEAAAVAGKPNDTIFALVKELMDYTIEMYKTYYSEDLTYADFVDKGVVEYTFENLTPGTDYVVLAMKLDPKTGIGYDGIAKKDFKTASVPKSNLTFDVAVGASSIVVTPSDLKALWDYYMVLAEDFMENWGGDKDRMAADYFSEWGTYYAAPGAYEFDYQDIVNSYEKAGDFVLLLWGVDKEIGAINTDIFKYEFNIPNTFVPAEAPAKAANESLAPKKLDAKKAMLHTFAPVPASKKVIR